MLVLLYCLLVVALCVTISTNPLAIPTALVLAAGACLLQGMRYVPADPLTKAIKTLFGTPQNKVLGPGWHFFLFHPFVEGYIKVNAKKVPQTVEIEILMPAGSGKNKTPVSIKIPIPLEWIFDDENSLPYLKSGKEEEIRVILEKIVTDCVQELINSEEKGPQSYEELIRADEEIINAILKALLGDEGLGKIPSQIPTSILLKFCREKKTSPTPSESRVYGENWENLQTDLSPIAPATTDDVKEAVRQRREHIQRARQGRGNFQKKDLGIRILRLGLGKIEPIGDILSEMNEVERARLRREIVNEDLENFRRNVQKHAEETHVPPTTANDAVQVHMGKVKKTIEEKRTTHGVGPEIVELAQAIVKAFRDKTPAGKEEK